MTTQLFDLTGKIALVTGASRGIGEAIAELLAEQGAHVIVSSRKLEGCQVVADAIIARVGAVPKPFPVMSAIWTILQRIFSHIKEIHGRLDILVNNAATNPYFGDILDTDLAAYNKTVDVNIRGYFFMSIAAGKLMKQCGSGAIVNTASVNALEPGHWQGIYSITKAAVVNMTRAFAKELAPLGIRVNALLPGLTETKFAGAMFSQQEIYQEAIKSIPMGRHAQPREMAGTVLYLVSDASSFTTGECIVVDGGMTI